MKKQLLILIAITLFSLGNLYSQTLVNGVTYRFNAANTATAAVTQTNLIGANADEVASAVTPIGFTFWFAGTPYTDFSVNENGLMTLGTTPILGTESVNQMASATTLPKIAPYWDDLATGTNGYVGYQLTGVAPNRILRVKWFVTVPKNVAGAANAMFQAELYEQTMSIHFAFGPTYPAANTNGYSMGVGVAADDFASVTVTGNTFATVAYGTANNNNTMAPGGGSVKRYQFGTDYTAPAISTQTIPNTPGIANRSLTKTITDLTPYNGTGVPITGTNMPRIYYKKGNSGTWVSTQGTLVSGTNISGTWNFTIDHSLVGGVVPGDQIFYYVIAQDQSNALGHPNIASIPAGVVAVDVNNVTTPPAAPSVYTIGNEFSGIKTVGTGGDYASLTNTGGLFDLINGGMLTGNLTIKIISDLTNEAGTVALNTFVTDAGGPYTLTIIPDGGARTILGGSNIIRLTGTTGVLIDGLNDGTNALTITSSAGTPITLTGASNNTITKVNITGYSSSGGAVVLFNNTATTPCSYNTISYCTISSIGTSFFSYQGILYNGTGTTGTGNIVDHSVFTNFGYYAIHKGFTTTSTYTNFTISNNEIYNTAPASERQYYKAICLEGNSGNSSIFNNKIHDLLVSLSTNSGSYITAINTTNVAGNVTSIYNNVIYLDATVNHPLQAWTAIEVANAGSSDIYFNSIHIAGSSTNASVARGIVKSAVGTANVIDNIVYISRTGSANTALSLSGTVTQSNNFITDPGFTSPTYLLPTNFAVGAGIPVAGITTDITGALRSTVSPTIGAYELAYKSLNISALPEGLYAGNSTLNQAYNENGIQWGAGIADVVTIELHNANNYATIEYSAAAVNLSTAGTANISIAASFSGNYYVTLKHRNSIEITSALPVSFGAGIINIDFTNPANVFGGNLKSAGSQWVVMAGDVNQDGIIDSGDMTPVFNLATQASAGYLPEDINGDGLIDSGDMTIIFNNAIQAAGIMTP